MSDVLPNDPGLGGPPLRRAAARDRFIEAVEELPLLVATSERWAELAERRLPEFLADHAVCEQQAALFGLHLVAYYPDDAELVDKMTALAAEEVMHLRRVSQLLQRRGLRSAPRRANSYVQALHGRISRPRAEELKCDRLLVGALIEARSCERFTRLLARIVDSDPELADLLFDLGPAEKRHWKAFHGLAARGWDPRAFLCRWQGWLEFERELMSGRGVQPTVHG